ncbi:hypothetical protein KIN20_007350 [Parelaphostrongylus tenuis]|uniref:Rieske domain-containing protein n=1 Tax=Parelaphostrongylus tenuis TaxID=148309 RepID=A0AAD5QHS7_PARTN|nr:hypothetical protein KIN20_007350 [Parelaphostrongylus tenuis]
MDTGTVFQMACTVADNFDTSSNVNEVLGKTSEVPPGTKKMFYLREKPILVINDDGNLYAITGICSHYKNPLEDGVYSKGRIRCPLHGACFNVKTGDIEDYPGFDSLYSYEVEDIDGDLILNTTENQLANTRRTRKSTVTLLSDDFPIIVVGGGISAESFVEHARINGCSAPITMITQDRLPPYDRVKLSKNPVVTAEEIRLRSDEYYKEILIDIMTSTRVVGVDVAHRSVYLSSGESMRYSKLVLALGCVPRELTIPGSDLRNVYTLRTVDEANTIADASIGKHVVCIGGSFIGMEIASSLMKTAASVTVVCDTEEPFPAFGTDIGKVIRHRFEAKGVQVIVNDSAEQLEGDVAVSSVTLKSGKSLAADVVVVGIGVVPPTDWLKNTLIELDERGFVKVDGRFRTTADWVYAIGDVVSAPLDLWDIDAINIQHFQTAQTHGQLLGYSILGRPFPHQVVPFFWTVLFSEFGIRLAGSTVGATKTIVHGSIDDLKFVKYYLKDNVVVAVANAGMPTAIQFLELFERGIKITIEDVETNTTDDWIEWLLE